jgi:hypothetical protein
MNYIQKLLLLTAFLSSSVAFGQLTADPEERQERGKDPLRTQTPEGRPLPFSERLRFGGGIGPFAFSTGYTALGISPVVAYQASERTIIGVGLSYVWTKYKAPYYYPGSQNQFGGRAFAMYEFIPSLIQNLYLHGEVQTTNVSYQDAASPGVYKATLTAPLVGLTYMQPISRRFGINLSALYNLNYNSNTALSAAVYGGSPLVLRLSFF